MRVRTFSVSGGRLRGTLYGTPNVDKQSIEGVFRFLSCLSCLSM